MQTKHVLNSDYDQIRLLVSIRIEYCCFDYPTSVSNYQLFDETPVYQFPNIFSDLFFFFELHHWTITFRYIDWNCTVYPSAGKYQRWMYQCGARNVAQSFCTIHRCMTLATYPFQAQKPAEMLVFIRGALMDSYNGHVWIPVVRTRISFRIWIWQPFFHLNMAYRCNFSPFRPSWLPSSWWSSPAWWEICKRQKCGRSCHHRSGPVAKDVMFDILLL